MNELTHLTLEIINLNKNNAKKIRIVGNDDPSTQSIIAHGSSLSNSLKNWSMLFVTYHPLVYCYHHAITAICCQKKLFMQNVKNWPEM